MSTTFQSSILASPLACGRSLSFDLRLGREPKAALARLRNALDPRAGVVGLGDPLARVLGREIPGLRVFPAIASAEYALPSAQHALWVYLRGADRGAVFDLSQTVSAALDEAFELVDSMDTFTYAQGRDLSGYVDGTANPEGDSAVVVAIAGRSAPAPGSSFVAVQRWVHDLGRFRAHSQDQRDAMIGRRLSDNEEIADAPESAHVKRAAQETFSPMAFMVRRSQPWAAGGKEGLEFIAYGASLDPFERVLRHMAGEDDGLRDALFAFSRPVNGGFYWCPPVSDGKLDLAALGV